MVGWQHSQLLLFSEWVLGLLLGAVVPTPDVAVVRVVAAAAVVVVAVVVVVVVVAPVPRRGR